MAHMEYVLRLHSTFYEPSDHNNSYYMWSNTLVPEMMLLHKHGLVQKSAIAGFFYFILWPMGIVEKKILIPIHAHELQM